MPPGGDLCTVVFQGPEFIQFLQQEYLPSLQVAPEISQVHGSPELLLHSVSKVVGCDAAWHLQRGPSGGRLAAACLQSCKT